MRLITLSLITALLLASCEQGSKEPQQQPEQTAAPQPAATTLPSLPMDILKNLWDNCDYVDYVFYNLPISMSLNNQPSIQNSLSHIASDPAPVLPQCKSIGRLFYQIKGENVQMAEIYFTAGCTYFVFLKDDKPAYSNYITPEGVAYLNNIFSQAGIKPEQIR